jgi:bifunctional DNA-binding transcriptional regulator/antitoxin component of YhaV-PrlF toxin-antitoxin module
MKDMSMGHVMRVSGNGQVSLPAATRRRWSTGKVLVVDMGDYVIVRPAADRSSLRGKYRGRLPSTDTMRAEARAEESARDAGRP